MKNPRDRKFMERAIKEMLKSRGEHSTKVDPLVGAVLGSSKGRIMGTAHRGNLRSGEHAEFTLLDKKLIGTDVAGATLYVTLEPCTTRNSPKKTMCRAGGSGSREAGGEWNAGPKSSNSRQGHCLPTGQKGRSRFFPYRSSRQDQGRKQRLR